MTGGIVKMETVINAVGSAVKWVANNPDTVVKVVNFVKDHI